MRVGSTTGLASATIGAITFSNLVHVLGIFRAKVLAPVIRNYLTPDILPKKLMVAKKRLNIMESLVVGAIEAGTTLQTADTEGPERRL